MTDHELVSVAAGGDCGAFDELTRRVVELLFEGSTRAEVAAALGLEVVTVNVHHRARKVLAPAAGARPKGFSPEEARPRA